MAEGDSEKDALEFLVEQLYMVEGFYNEQITGLERQINNASIKRDEVSKNIDEYEKQMGNR